MYKIGIIGSGPERFTIGHMDVRRVIGNIINTLAIQYGNDDIVFNIKSDIGVGLWASEECVNRGYKYHLFLPRSLEKTSEHWYDDQKQMLVNQYNSAYSLTISSPSSKFNYDDESYDQLIFDSNFLVCFWSRACDSVRDVIKKAIKHNVMVLDGLNDLKLVTKEDLINKRHVASRSHSV
jgi:hypothetical protein